MSLVPPEKFRQAISTGNHNLLREYALQTREHISTHDDLPEDYFNFLLSLSGDRGFLKLGGAGEFLIIFDDERFLTDNQRQRLIPVKQFFYKDFYGDMNPEGIKEALNDSISSANVEKFDNYCLTINTEFLGFGFFPEYWFDFFITLLVKKDFLNLQAGSSNLLNFFELNWSDLSDDQKERL